jgi:hypothetical protein
MIDAAEILSGPARLPRNPIDLLRRLIECGHVRAAQKLLSDHSDWVRNLPTGDAEVIGNLIIQLSALQAVEREYGPGAALDLQHPVNKRFMQLRRLIDCFTDEELKNAANMVAAKTG